MSDGGARDTGRSERGAGAWRWVGLPLVGLLSTLVLLNTEVLPLDAVRQADLASDYGLLTWNLWATTEAVRHGESPYETRLLFHPLGSNLAAHTLGPGFASAPAKHVAPSNALARRSHSLSG